MSSDLQSAVTSLVLSNYLSLAGCTIVGYDYILMFSREVDYIWHKRWSWVSGVFILVRYPGICWALLSCGLIGTTFIPGPVTVSNVLFLVSCWTFPVFICAADLVMILRIYTIWGRSRTILRILLFVYVVQIIVSVVLPAIYNSNPNYFTPSIYQLSHFSLCNGTFSPAVPMLLGLYAALPRFVLSVMLLVLAITKTLRQLVEMYKATKTWQPNRYLNIFARDGTYYFFINTVYNIVTVIGSVSPTTANFTIALDVLGTFSTTLICTAMPRFIIGVREMYERDVRGRFQGVDTGFGFKQNTPEELTLLRSEIAFADVADGSRTILGDASGPGTVSLGEIGQGAHSNLVV